MPIKDFLPLVTAPLGAAGILLQEWRQKRDRRFQRKQARTDATEMVELIQKLLQAQQLACSPEELELAKRTAGQQLELISNTLLNVH